MVWPLTISPDRHARLAPLGEEVEGVVVVAEEHGHAPVAALGDAVRQVRDDVAGDAGHSLTSRQLGVSKVSP